MTLRPETIEAFRQLGWADLDFADVDSHHGRWQKGELTGRRFGKLGWEKIPQEDLDKVFSSNSTPQPDGRTAKALPGQEDPG